MYTAQHWNRTCTLGHRSGKLIFTLHRVSECPTIDYITHNSLITLTFLSTFHWYHIGCNKAIKGWHIFPFKAAENPNICLSGGGFTTVNTVHLRDTITAEQEQRTTQQRIVLNFWFWPKLRKYSDSFSCNLSYTGRIILQPSSLLNKRRRPVPSSFIYIDEKNFYILRDRLTPNEVCTSFQLTSCRRTRTSPLNLRPALFMWNSVKHCLMWARALIK